MNKTDLIADVAGKTGLTKKDTEKTINALFSSIQGALANGEQVTMIGFGTFKVRDRAARNTRNPQTGEAINLPATKVPAFKAGKTLKENVV